MVLWKFFEGWIIWRDRMSMQQIAVIFFLEEFEGKSYFLKDHHSNIAFFVK
jgi:hypothetical protein